MHDADSIRELFEAAVRVGRDGQADLLDQVADERVRDLLARLLAGDATGGPLDEPLDPRRVLDALSEADGVGPAPPEASLVGRTIGGFRVLRLLGRGGMGDVYEAEQAHPHRRVALKVLRSSLAPRATMRRFAREVEILARLRHPHIAQVHEAGWHETDLGGVPWFAMELVEDAERLDEHVRRRNLDRRARLEMFALVGEAVQYGHGQGFIHRDLKPANILVDRDGAPRIIDFGVARSTDIDISIATLQTSAGELVGTLRYMSPEQCGGDPGAVDIRSDVYALGVILHELLVDASPYGEITRTSAVDLPRIIREVDPRSLRQVDRTIPTDLETIVRKCLQKSPARRYATVAELVQDVRSFLADEPIVARRDQTLYVLRKLVRRHRAASVAAGIVLAVLVAAAGGMSVLYGRSESQRRLSDERAEALRRQTYLNAIALAANALEDDDVTHMLTLLERCPEDLRQWEWWHLRATADDATRTFETAEVVQPKTRGRDRTWTPFGVRPAGDLAALAGPDGAVHLWDLEADRLVRTLEGHVDPVFQLQFSRDGRLLATGDRGSVSNVRIWEVDSGTLISATEAPQQHVVHCFSPDGREYLAAVASVIAVVDVATGRTVRRLEGHQREVTGVAVSPDGRFVVSGSYDQTVRVWRFDDGREIARFRGMELWNTGVAFSPDGARVLWGDAIGNVREVEIASRRDVRVFPREAGRIESVEWSPDGRRIMYATQSSIKVVDAASGAPVATLHAGGKIGGRPTFLGDSRRIAAGSLDGRLRIFDLEAPRARQVIGRGGGFVATSRDGRWAATAREWRRIQLWDLERHALALQWPAHVEASKFLSLAFDPQGTRLATSATDRTIRLWQIPDGADVGVVSTGDRDATQLRWMPDGAALVCAMDDGIVEVRAMPGGERLATLDPGDPVDPVDYFSRSSPCVLAVAPDGRLLATAGLSGTIRLWSWPGLAPVGSCVGHGALVRSLAFSPDGALLASAGHDGTFRLWDVTTGTERHRLAEPGQYCLFARFSPDGRRLVTATTAPAYRLWDVESGTPVMQLVGHSGGSIDAGYAGDGRRIVTVGSDADVRIWDAPGFAVEDATRSAADD